MKVSPKISIIVPIYNAERFLRQCTDSILNQKFVDFELILVDDGSTDTSLDICHEYLDRDKRVKVIHKTNGGVSSARNAGLEVARGSWICFIDADDYIEQGFFPLELNEEIDLYVTNWDCYSIPGLRKDAVLETNKLQKHQLYSFFSKKLHITQFRTPWAKIFKKCIIDENKLLFDNKIRIGEDTIFVTQYLQFINNLSILQGSKYIFYRDPNVGIDDVKKYKQSVNDSVYFLNRYFEVYKILPFRSKSMEEMMLTYFGYICSIQTASRKDHFKWTISPGVIGLRRALGRYDGIKGRLKYLLLKTVSPVLNCIY